MMPKIAVLAMLVLAAIPAPVEATDPTADLLRIERSNAADAFASLARAQGLELVEAPLALGTPLDALAAAVRFAEVQHALALASEPVDVSRLASGELAILRAIEHAAPLLANAPPAPVDLAPWLVVKGTGDDVWTEEAALMIDLGGNDAWTNGAGAGRLDTNPVSVALDLGGDDRYERAWTDTTSSLSVAAQGAGVFGIGALVDLGGGSDAYRVSARVTPPELAGVSPDSALVAQGGAVAGAGALVDDGGDDTFEALAATAGGHADLVAQGAARVGIALFHASPSLAHAKTSSAVLHVATTSASDTYAIGTGLTLAHGAAQDGAAAAILGSAAPTLEAYSTSPEARVVAQGAAEGLAAAAVALLANAPGSAPREIAIATGDARLDVEVQVACQAGRRCAKDVDVSQRLGLAEVLAQGAAIGGVALLDDSAADHAWRTAQAHVAANLRVFVSNAPGSTGDQFTANADLTTGDALVRAQGAARGGSGTLLTALDNSSIAAHVLGYASASASGAALSNTATARAIAGDADARGLGWGEAGGAGVTGLGLRAMSVSSQAIADAADGASAVDGMTRTSGPGADDGATGSVGIAP